MLIEQLRNTENLTENEKNVAKYILENLSIIKNLSIRELADATFTSTSTISRLCNKLGVSGFQAFKIQLNTEYTYSIENDKFYDDNYPFKSLSSAGEILDSIANIEIRGIRETLSKMDTGNMQSIVKMMERSNVIYIFAKGASLNAARDFKSKMMKINKPVITESSNMDQLVAALSATKNDLIIIVSYSGESMHRIIHTFIDRDIPIIGITGLKESFLRSKSTKIIEIGSREANTMLAKIDSFNASCSVSFIFNCLYAMYFRLHYDENIKKIISARKYLE